jgi:hypothetical protein
VAFRRVLTFLTLRAVMTSLYFGITERENEPYLRHNMRKPPAICRGLSLLVKVLVLRRSQ